MQAAHHIRVRLKASVSQNIDGGPGYRIVGLFILGAVVDILKFTDGVVFERVLHVVEVHQAIFLVQQLVSAPMRSRASAALIASHDCIGIVEA